MTSDKRDQPNLVGHRLRQLRHAQGKTLEVIAGLAGISPSYRAAPGRSVRAITTTAGISHNRLAYWLRPGVHPEAMPTLREIADALGCELVEVSRAFAADIGLPLGQEMLTAEEQALLDGYRELTARDQATVRALLDHLRQSPPE